MYQKKTHKWVLFTTIVALIFSFSISCFAFEKEIKAMAFDLSENILKAGRKTIAVVDFNDLQGNVTELGRFFAEEFSVALASAGKDFEVVDRTNLKTILIEHKLSTTGIIDPQTARKLGQIAGVDALITGTITPFGDTVRVTVKILDTNTARVIGATSGDIAKTKAIDELLAKGIEGNLSNSNTSSHSKTTFTKQTTTKSINKLEVKNIVFDIQNCKISSNSLECDLLITNIEKDINLVLYTGNMSGGARMFDEEGIETRSSQIQFGGKSSSYEVESLLVSGVPTKTKIIFNGVQANISLLALLEISCTPRDPDGSISQSNNFKVKFRNVPISKPIFPR